ncbi:MAG: 2-amino-4-hydroxy-6-hydroxymethyldihydropteridine diphosphokinase [Lachnospirales bacterium]
MNRVIIKGLECFGNHGVLKEENILGQKFVVSVEMITNDTENDDINTAVNYAEVSKYITNFVSKNTFKLIETLANKLAIEILKNFEVNEITLKIEKPFAPIGLPLETVAVEVSKKWSEAFLGIGSNIGDKKKYLDMAVCELKNNDCIKVIKVSDYIVTKAYGYTEQDDFLNGAIEIKTILTPKELLDFTSSIEKKADRKREIHWGPRTLDVDILLYEDFKIAEENLTIPHIDMHNREFVLKPLCQIAPYAYHNGLNKTVLELYLEVNK